jgi:hypothetical protein
LSSKQGKFQLSDLRKSRNSAVSLQLHLDSGDAVREMVSREDGLFFITAKQIVRVRSPDHLDPDLKQASAPWEQSLYLPHGASDPLVARTIIQTARLAEMFFAQTSDQYKILSDISWEVMNSLQSLRFIKNRLEDQIKRIVALVENDMAAYTAGKSPKPLPTVEYYDIEFRSFANEVRRTLSAISELFLPLIGQDFSNGHFHKAQRWAARVRGEDSLLSQMLKGDQRWIKAWIDIRIAIEHPQKGKFVETSNFSLEASRIVRLPTWRFVHPDYDLGHPQNLLTVFDACIDNLLKFYEDIQIALTDGHLPASFKIAAHLIPEDQRDPNLPLRYKFYATA